jgi:HlyD family secretion protein
MKYRILFFLAVFLSSCKKEKTEDINMASSPSKYAAIARGRVDLESGTIKLASSRDGIIRKVLVEEGDEVKANQLLAVIDTRQAEINVMLAKSELEQSRVVLAPLQVKLAAAERESSRNNQLVKSLAATPVDVENSQDQVTLINNEIASANAAILSAQTRLDAAVYEVEQRSIYAPSDGRILKRDARPGSGISTLNVTPLFVFAPKSDFIVRADVDEKFSEKLKVGQAVEITLESDESSVFQGKLKRIAFILGAKAQTDDPSEKPDQQVLECIVSIDRKDLIIGQRVIVNFIK